MEQIQPVWEQIQQQFRNLLSFAGKTWVKVNGWKATIGLILIMMEDKLDPYLPDTWWMELISILIYLWTGVGLTHKAKKTLKRRNNG